MEFRLEAIVTVNVATLWQRNGRRVGADPRYPGRLSRQGARPHTPEIGPEPDWDEFVPDAHAVGLRADPTYAHGRELTATQIIDILKAQITPLLT